MHDCNESSSDPNPVYGGICALTTGGVGWGILIGSNISMDILMF